MKALNIRPQIRQTEQRFDQSSCHLANPGTKRVFAKVLLFAISQGEKSAGITGVAIMTVWERPSDELKHRRARGPHVSAMTDELSQTADVAFVDFARERLRVDACQILRPQRGWRDDLAVGERRAVGLDVVDPSHHLGDGTQGGIANAGSLDIRRPRGRQHLGIRRT